MVSVVTIPAVRPLALKFNPTLSPSTKVLLFARLVSPLNDGEGPNEVLLAATGGVLLFAVVVEPGLVTVLGGAVAGGVEPLVAGGVEPLDEPQAASNIADAAIMRTAEQFLNARCIGDFQSVLRVPDEYGQGSSAPHRVSFHGRGPILLIPVRCQSGADTAILQSTVTQLRGTHF